MKNIIDKKKGEYTKMKIITDSTSDLSIETANKLGVHMMPLGVNFGDSVFKDKFEITNQEFFKKLEESKDIPTTNLINPADFEDVFNMYPDEDIIVIPIAKELSGTYQSAVIAKEMLSRENIYIIDSKTVTVGLALLVYAALQYQSEGMPTSQIVYRIQEDVKKVQIVAVFDTLKYLIKGGRLTKIQGTIGTALNLKPILSVADGELSPIAKCRGNKSAYKEMLRIIAEDLVIDSERKIIYAHANSPEMLSTFKEISPYEGMDEEIGSVVGTHSGPGAIAIAYFKK